MKLTTIIITLFSASPLFAQVGLMHKTYTDNTRNRTLETYIFYPAKEASTNELGGNRVFKGFNATQDAELKADKKLPLIVLAHGTSGNWKNLTWIASPMVANGAIAVATNHPGSTTGDATPASVIQMWNQPEDVSFLIDQLLQSDFAHYTDTGKIIVMGSSLGGYTALALSGAILDFERFLPFCMEHDDISIAYFKPALKGLDNEFYIKANQPHSDPRIDAAIALVPGFVEAMTKESLQNLKVPTLIIGASLDENVPPKTHFRPFIPTLTDNPKYIEISDATHFSFLQECKPGALEILAEENAEFACLEKGEKTREEIHKEVLKEIRTFLQQEED